MKDSIRQKLDGLQDRYEELAALLSDPDIISNQDKFRKLSIEYSELEPVTKCYSDYQQAEADKAEALVMISDSDPDMKAMGQEELSTASEGMDTIENELQALMLPKDPNDGCNVFLEIRAGTGGDEAAIFAGDLFRMYSRYADSQKWKIEKVSENIGEHGGYREVISRVVGANVYSRMKFESGAHRVQRVPETESQGRVHTSACTVAVMPEPDDVEEINIRKEDLRIDTFRSSGAGGQHVNTTDSAIRITHIPTGVVVECQDERSQHKNKAKAMGWLQAKLMSAAQESAAAETAEQRRSLVGSGDRSERIRTYNFPQGRMTDHRINLTLYKLDEIIEGSMEELLNALAAEHQADQLAAMSE